MIHKHIRYAVDIHQKAMWFVNYIYIFWYTILCPLLVFFDFTGFAHILCANWKNRSCF